MFFITPVNYVAILAAAASSMVVGFLWYSPILFAKPWMKYSKLDAKKLKNAQKHMSKTYSLSFLAALITAYVIALIFNATLIINISEGLSMGALLWLGFTATTMVTGVLFQEMPWRLFLINSGYQLVSILVMSAILTVWI